MAVYRYNKAFVNETFNGVAVADQNQWSPKRFSPKLAVAKLKGFLLVCIFGS